MRAIDRYIFRQLLLATVFVAGVLVLLITLFGSLRLFDFVVNRGLPMWVLFELSALSIPRTLAIVLPVAILASVIVVYNKLLNESELIVMRASGLSQWSLAKAGIVLTLLGLLVGYALHLYLVPTSLYALKTQQHDYRNAYGSILLQEQKFNTPVESVTVYVRSRSDDGELHGIFAHDARDPERPTTYLAERGATSQTSEGSRVVLFNGSQQRIDRATGRLTLFYFDQYSLDLGLFSDTPEMRWRQPEERLIGDLFEPSDSLHDRVYADALHVEGHRRLTTPLFVVVFALIGLAAMLSGEFSRRGQTNRILAAIAVVFAIQVASLGLVNMARRTLVLVPLLYAFPIAAIVASLIVLLRNRRRRATTAPDDLRPHAA